MERMTLPLLMYNLLVDYITYMLQFEKNICYGGIFTMGGEFTVSTIVNQENLAVAKTVCSGFKAVLVSYKKNSMTYKAEVERIKNELENAIAKLEEYRLYYPETSFLEELAHNQLSSSYIKAFNTINDALSKINAGNKAVANSSKILGDIEVLAEDMLAKLTSISERAVLEADSINQINVSVRQLNSITGENSNLAESNASSAKEVRERIEDMVEQINNFKF